MLVLTLDSLGSGGIHTHTYTHIHIHTHHTCKHTYQLLDRNNVNQAPASLWQMQPGLIVVTIIRMLAVVDKLTRKLLLQ